MRAIVPILLRPPGPVSLGKSIRHKFLNTISILCKLHRAAPMVDGMALAFMGCSIVAMVMVLCDVRLLHWFVIPVVICGSIIGSDAVIRRIKAFRA